MPDVIAVTGLTGFVGGNVNRYFSSDPAMDVRPLNLREGLDEHAILDCDVVIHLAGKAHDLKNVSSPEEYYRVNYELTKTLFDRFLASRASKFIFISSVKAVADVVEGVLNEDMVPNPGSHYGKSKLMAEEYIRSRSLPPGKFYYILRPCIIHGPGNKGNLNLLYQLVRKGIPYPLGGFKNKRSFLSVENLCFILHEIIRRRDVPSGVYNVCDDGALCTEDVVNLISISLNKRPRQYSLNKSIVYSAARIGDRLHLPFNTERLNKLVTNYSVSNARIKEALNMQLPLSSREGLLITFKSFSRNE